MPRIRTRTVSTKVSEDDHALLKQLAGDQRVGEWVRDVLFKAVLAERAGEAHRTILRRSASRTGGISKPRASAASATRKPRCYRTGRNVEFIAGFLRSPTPKDGCLGETLEKAVETLKNEISKGGRTGEGAV